MINFFIEIRTVNICYIIYIVFSPFTPPLHVVSAQIQKYKVIYMLSTPPHEHTHTPFPTLATQHEPPTHDLS